MRINHNLAALNTHRQLTTNTGGTNKSLEKLSSGFRINRAGDDAAGLAISEKMRGQIRGLEQASRNAQDAISLIQTAEGAMSTTHNILQRMRELAVQSANDTSTDSDRAQLQKEIEQLKSEVDRIAYTTEFNTKKLLNGSLTANKVAQGTIANSAAVDVVDIAATNGTYKAGNAVITRGALAASDGQGATEIGINALAEKTIIIAGVNDGFSVTINGVEHSGLKIAASTGSGYTRQEFADAIEEAINNALSGSGTKTEFHQVNVSITQDNKLQFTTATPGIETTFSIAASTSGLSSALSAMGFMGKQDKIESGIDITAGITFASGAVGGFNVVLGSSSGSVSGMSGTYTKEELIEEIQRQLDTSFGTGIVNVSDSDNDGKLELSTVVSTRSFYIGSGTAGTSSGLVNLWGAAANNAQMSGGIIASGSTTVISGANSSNGYADGIMIVAGANDQFNISVDGEAAQTITLTGKLYASQEDLVKEINTQIRANANLIGRVTASLDNDGKVTFIATSTGTSSTVNVTDPSSAAQSALVALGMASDRGTISGSVDISDGIRMSGLAENADDFKFVFQLGNKSATINLLDQEGFFQTTTATNMSGATTRDAIVKGFQAELDKAFGSGSISVNTVRSGSEEVLRFTSTAKAAEFNITSANSGAALLIDAAAASGATFSGIKSATPLNTSTIGEAAIDNTLDRNTKLVDLVDKDGNGLGLASGNVITFTGTQNGVEFKTSVTVAADTTIDDLLDQIRDLDAFAGASIELDVANGQLHVSGAYGAINDLSNLKLQAQSSATNSTAVGNFNRLFDKFTVVQQAQDSASDASLIMQIGANQGQVVNVDINNLSASSLKIHNVDVSTKDGAQSAITVINNALDFVSEERSKLGAIQNRLEHTISNLGTSAENLTASESRIRDVDMAKEMMEFTKNNILSQAAQAMLAQANQQPQGVLQLLR